MSDRIGAPYPAPTTPHMSQPDEFLRRGRLADADRQAHAAATHVSTSGLTRTGRATLTRLQSALGV